MNHIQFAMAEDEGSFKQIENALESWLEEISDLQERQEIIRNYQEKISRTLLQIQFDGLISINDFAVLNYIGQTWTELMTLLSQDIIDKRAVVANILKLYDANQISRSLFIEIVTQLQ